MKYKVFATVTSYPYIIVEAKSEAEAIQIANDADGGDFIDTDEADWEINPALIEEISNPII